MAEIKQPTPIKPVWPTRHEQAPRGKVPNRREQTERREDRRGRDERDSDRPAFDDYA